MQKSKNISDRRLVNVGDVLTNVDLHIRMIEDSETYYHFEGYTRFGTRYIIPDTFAEYVEQAETPIYYKEKNGTISTEELFLEDINGDMIEFDFIIPEGAFTLTVVYFLGRFEQYSRDTQRRLDSVKSNYAGAKCYSQGNVRNDYINIPLCLLKHL